MNLGKITVFIEEILLFLDHIFLCDGDSGGDFSFLIYAIVMWDSAVLYLCCHH